MIAFREASKSFDGGRTFAVERLSLEIERGELVVFVGGSGAGKTTALKMINRLIDPTEGVVEVDGRDVRDVDPISLRRGIGYVIQRDGLLPHMTVAENIETVPRLLGWSREDRRARTDELLEMVHLPAGEYRGRMPGELSGGQRQRVGIARGLAARPPALLMDEPFGALDAVTRASLQRELRDLHRSLGVTIVMVTHDMAEALLLADRVAVMEGGRLARVDTPGALLRERDDEVVRALVETPWEQARALERLAEDSLGGEGS